MQARRIEKVQGSRTWTTFAQRNVGDRLVRTVARLVPLLCVLTIAAHGGPASAVNILHFEDYDSGTTAVPGALSQLGLNDSTVTATSVADFNDKL
ncbi:MAG TPA: hypothetical protein VL403_14275, partial [Candidatus Kryptonia bacterium]|nr:hypothetical protein [Candidatus Kryptonia bacterium]